jgi:hypothetical protein
MNRFYDFHRSHLLSGLQLAASGVSRVAPPPETEHQLTRYD